MASVTFENVVKRYGNITAVSNLNLEIPDKEFLVFVGPSGCGKSTSLRMLAGLEDISEGTIYIGERPVNDVPPKDRDIAMVFQSYALYPHMSVYDNMAFALKLRAKTGRLRKMFTAVFNRGAYNRLKAEEKDIDDRVQKAASILGIQQLLPRKPRQLSGGQRQRVAVGAPSCASPRSSFRRAALQPRRETPRADARRDHQATSAVGHHLHLRDPRPDGSDDDGDAHRRDERRPSAAGRLAAEVVRLS
jgi:multiple sugar transport system ATP-binding protein